jgi:hypothetical protein
MSKLEKACLIEIDHAKVPNEKSGAHNVVVQFNPETLKVTFSNQIARQKGTDQSSGNGGLQYLGEGTTKLVLTLWFDVTAMIERPVDDVRRLTGQVIYFTTPQPSADDKEKLVPPGVRFSWGKFLFDGVVEALEETLEYFSPDGRALRASMSLTLSQQKILVIDYGATGKIGTSRLNTAKSGETLQSMAGAYGAKGPGGAAAGGWQGIAAANGIEDPLRLRPGQLVDLNARGGGSLGLSGGFGLPAAPSAPLPPAPRIALPSNRFGLN